VRLAHLVLLLLLRLLPLIIMLLLELLFGEATDGTPQSL